MRKPTASLLMALAATTIGLSACDDGHPGHSSDRRHHKRDQQSGHDFSQAPPMGAEPMRGHRGH